MFDRYTDRYRRVIVLAQEHARTLGHREIDVDHLLLGLADEGEGVAAQALGKAGVTVDGIRQAVAVARPEPGRLPFTRDMKRALELALRESVKLGHNYVGTEHLLLGVLEDCGQRPESPCWDMLRACGVTAGDVREEIMTLLRGYGDVPPPAADDDPRMAEVAAELAEIGRRLRRVHELLGIPA